MSQSDHDEQVREQFTAQAESFSRFAEETEAHTLQLVDELAQLRPDDEVLDVACGPGVVALGIARAVKHVTGVDLTPAMITKAAEMQKARGQTNLTWVLGSAARLPFPDQSFSLVFTRYSFHHLLDPAAVLKEIVRVTRPGGRIVVMDVYTLSADQAAAYDRLEKRRDPSHVHALSLQELRRLLESAGLTQVREKRFGQDMELERLLAGSCGKADDIDEIRRAYLADVGHDSLGLGAQLDSGELHFTFPIAVLCGLSR